jgi:nucleotide-binding universal stress UspA family protein
MIALRRILFPTDFSDLSRHVLSYARSFAESFEAELHMLHVVDESFQYWMATGPNSLPVGPSPEELATASEKAMADFVRQHLADATGMAIITKVVVGRPFLEIIRYSRDQQIDLIVLGTHGRSGLSHVLMGSVAEKVVRKAPCPVLSVRDPSYAFKMP